MKIDIEKGDNTDDEDEVIYCYNNIQFKCNSFSPTLYLILHVFIHSFILISFDSLM